jgi:hypothetical protein
MELSSAEMLAALYSSVLLVDDAPVQTIMARTDVFSRETFVCKRRRFCRGRCNHPRL